MLHLMRKYATTWMIKITLGAIVVVFVFWGVGSWREQRASRVAMVNGEPITIVEYKEAYNAVLDGLKQSFGNRLTDDILKAFQADRQAMNRVINQKLLLQEAKRLNLRVTDDELAANIRNIGAFHNRGIFDAGQYRRVLSGARLTPEAFEIIQRNAMLTEKLRSFIVGAIKVSEAEAREWFKWQEASTDIDILLFDPESYKEIQPTDDEISKYYEDKKETYKTEPKLKVRFIRFDPDTFADQVEIPEQDVTVYYVDNKEAFIIPKTVEARHILFKLEPEADDDTIAAVKNKALEVLKLAREGQDFSELAKEYSEGPSKEDGGYLGTFKRKDMVEPFGSTAFSMNAGDISEPVKTQFGWHLIKVEKVNDASQQPEAEAKEKIRQRMRNEKTKILAYDKAIDLYDSLFDGDDLSLAAKDRKLEAQTTDFFSRNDAIDNIKNPSTFTSAAFELSPMQISDVKEFDDGYYILQVVDKIPEKIPELADVRDTVTGDVIKKKQAEKAEADATACLESLKAGKSINAVSETFGIMAKATGLFKRRGAIPDVGYDQNIAAAAFKLSEGNPLPEGAIKGEKGYYVIQFRNRIESPEEDFEKEKSNLMNTLLETKQRRSFDAWLDQVRQASEIKYEEGFLDSQ